jgi:hypothetical protein
MRAAGDVRWLSGKLRVPGGYGTRAAVPGCQACIEANQEPIMRHLVKSTIACGAFAGALLIGAPAPSLAQVVVVDPYYAGPYYAGPYGYASPYGGYAYAPGYGGYRSWEYPIGEDSTGRPYFRSELGWRGGWPSGAPANPCYEGQRQKNLC